MNKIILLFASLLIIPPSSLALKAGEPMPVNLFVNLAKKLNPAVVSISTAVNTDTGTTHRPRGQFGQRDPFYDLFEQFLEQQRRARPKGPRPQGLGTGFVIREDGLIITNSHVISGADIITVSFSGNDTKYDAELIGKDKRTDIALIKIKSNKKFPTVKLGSSKKLQVGEWVAAFGNPYGHSHSMSKGIVSALNRDINELNRLPFIQTDASINPGNSGGPLVNVSGEVIGVNTAIDARAQGIGFAIPIDDVKSIIPILEKDGGLTRAFLGVNLRDVHPQIARQLGLKNTDGSLVLNVDNKTPAAKAGIKAYDFITHFKGQKIESSSDLIRAVSDSTAGSKAKLKLIRNGKKISLNVKLGTHPDSKLAAKKSTKSKTKDTGVKAPYSLGFRAANYSNSLAKQFNLTDAVKKYPVVTQVEQNSPARKAGLYPGDVILDINKKSVRKASDIKRRLYKSKLNILRVLRSNEVSLIFIEP